MLPNVNSVSNAISSKSFTLHLSAFSWKQGCVIFVFRSLSCCLATKHSYTQIFLLMTDTTLHETSQVFRWGTYVRNFELIVPKSSTFHQSIPVLQFSRPHVCSHCPLLDAVKVSVDMITWCTNSHNVHNYTCTVFHLEIVQGGMNRSEAERHELHCVHNASWVFFKKGGGGGMTPPSESLV